MLNEVLPMKIKEVVGLGTDCARDSREPDLESSPRGPIGGPLNRPTTLMEFEHEFPPPANLVRRSLDGTILESEEVREVFMEHLVRDSSSVRPFSQRLATPQFGDSPRSA
jgi:hypothetical protein